MTNIVATLIAVSSMLLQEPEIVHNSKLNLLCQYNLNYSPLLNLLSSHENECSVGRRAQSV